MPLHRLTQVIIGVPNVGETAAYYAEFGLSARALPGEPRTVDEQEDDLGDSQPQPREDTLSTADGGEQLRIVYRPRRRVVQLGVGAENTDDLDRIAANLTKLEQDFHRGHDWLTVVDPGTQARIRVEIAPRLVQQTVTPPNYNGPGLVTRDGRAPAIERTNPVRPRKLGHVVIGSTEQERSQSLFSEGLGFKISDSVVGRAAFMRCSTDHHNVLIQRAPVAFLHHTSWQVDDVDEVGRGASAMLEADPSRHVWGLGRHHIGSNFFWYLKDPAGNFSEYYSDLDCIVDDALWKPGIWEGVHGLYNWGPPPSPSFLRPDDLADLMASAHGARDR
jgi:hypothetical protein